MATDEDLKRWFGEDFVNPIFIDGWKLEAEIDWCWGEDGDEYPCLDYDLYAPDGTWKGRVQGPGEAKRIIDGSVTP